MKKKNPSKHFFRVLTLLFIIFIGLYIALESGYYQSKLSQKTTLTNENIKRFEEDVKNGVAIDINSYVIEEDVDYSNKVTRIGTNITEGINSLMTEGLKDVFGVLKTLFW